MSTLKHPETLDFESADLSHVWRKWKDEISLYLDLATKKDDNETKVKLFLYLIGSKGREIYETMEFETLEKDRTIELLRSFDEYCDPKRNETVERHKFFMRNQEADESFDKYLTDLKILVKICDFGTLSYSLIRNKIVCGFNTSSLRERLLREPNLTLKNCVDLWRQHETVKEKCVAYGKNYNRCEGKNHQVQSTPFTTEAASNMPAILSLTHQHYPSQRSTSTGCPIFETYHDKDDDEYGDLLKQCDSWWWCRL